MAYQILQFMFKKMPGLGLFLPLFLFFPLFSEAQWVYAIRNLAATPQFYPPPALIIFDVSTCSFCYIKELEEFPQQPVALANWPSGELVVLSSPFSNIPPFNSTLDFYNLPNTVPVNSVDFPGERLQSLVLFNGVYYATEQDTLYSLDPTTFQLTNLGNLPITPVGALFSLQLFENNGQLYVLAPTINQIWTVNTANPANSALLNTLNGIVVFPYGGFIATGGSLYISGLKSFSESGIFQYNITTNVVDPAVCLVNDWISNPIIYFPGFDSSPPYGMVEAPANHPYQSCICNTDAGILQVPNENICGNTVNLNPQVPPVLDNNDLILYILFTDQTDPEGSTILTSATPVFTVNPPTIQLGTTYFVAAIAGNNVSGSVDFDDLCFSISNIIPIVFWPPPALSLAVGQQQICTNECVDITANLTAGSPPFSFSYEVVLGGSIIGTQTFNNLNTNPFVFELCLPPGITSGQVTVSVTDLADKRCICP